MSSTRFKSKTMLFRNIFFILIFISVSATSAAENEFKLQQQRNTFVAAERALKSGKLDQYQQLK